MDILHTDMTWYFHELTLHVFVNFPLIQLHTNTFHTDMVSQLTSQTFWLVNWLANRRSSQSCRFPALVAGDQSFLLNKDIPHIYVSSPRPFSLPSYNLEFSRATEAICRIDQLSQQSIQICNTLLSRKTVWEVATAPAAAGTLFFCTAQYIH